MSMETCRASLKWDKNISIGGGEPTIHPHFWEILGLCLREADSVWLATNGKKTKTAISLAKLAKRGEIGCRLSITQFHNPIDHRVVNAFHSGQELYGDKDGRAIAGYLANPMMRGRFKDQLGLDSCGCPEAFVRPSGRVYQCGCLDSPCVGNVFDGYQCFSEDGEWKCWREVVKCIA